MILRSRVVVSMAGEPIENGAVAISGNQIAGVGRFAEVRASHGGYVLDLGEQVLLPGLINGHCHLDYTLLRGQIAPQKSFTDWIRAINASKAAVSEDDYVASIEAGLAEVQKFGTTTLLNLAAFPELLPRVHRSPLRTWWCVEMIDIRGPVPAQKLSDNLGAWFHSHPEAPGGLGLAPHAPYTASAQLYSEASALSQKNGLLLTTHLAESHEEMLMFRDATGPLFEFLQSIGRVMDDCGQATPLSHLTRSQEINESWVVAHLNEIAESDFDLLARGRKFHIVHCPCSHAFFGHRPFAVRELQKLGFNICLGTDSLASNSSLSLFSEMRALIRQEPSVSPREALTMATVNGGHALRQTGSLGRISPGFRADLIALPSVETGREAFDAIVAFEGTVAWMMVDGEILEIR